METSIPQAKQKRYAWLFLEVSEEEKVFYQRFVARHGGAFVEVEQPAGGYRLDFPLGTRIVPNEEEQLPLDESYHLLYPDGVRITWYRAIKMDRRVLRDVLLVPVPDDDDWALFEKETCQAAP